MTRAIKGVFIFLTAAVMILASTQFAQAGRGGGKNKPAASSTEYWKMDKWAHGEIIPIIMGIHYESPDAYPDCPLPVESPCIMQYPPLEDPTILDDCFGTGPRVKMTFFMRVDVDQTTSYTFGGMVPSVCWAETYYYYQQCMIEEFIRAKVITKLGNDGLISGGPNACFCVKSINRLYDDPLNNPVDCWDDPCLEADPDCMPFFTVVDFTIAVERKPPDGECIKCYDLLPPPP